MDASEYRWLKFRSGKPQFCWMCGCDLTYMSATVDHLRPKSKKGKDKKENYRLACKPCNSERGNRRLTKDEWSKAKGREKPKGHDYSALIQAIKRQNEKSKHEATN